MILQQSDQEAADCNHVSEREREYNIGEGKDNTTKQKQKNPASRYLHVLCYNTSTIKSGFYFILFFFVHFLYVATNKSELQKF